MVGISKKEEELFDIFHGRLNEEKINFFTRIVEEMGVKLEISKN